VQFQYELDRQRCVTHTTILHVATVVSAETQVGTPSCVTPPNTQGERLQCAQALGRLSSVFRDMFLEGLEAAFKHQQLVFHGDCLPHWQTTRPLQHSWTTCRHRTGWCKRSLRLAVHNMFCSIWLVIPIVSLSPITGFFRSTNPRSASRWRDYKNHNKKRTMTLTGEEFLPPLSSARAAEGFPPHSLLRMASQPKAWTTTATLPRSPESAHLRQGQRSPSLKLPFKNVRSATAPCA
jgi:hypothetical protein